MKSISIIISLVLLISIPTSFADVGIDGKWFCNSQRPEFEEKQYKDSLELYNKDAKNYFLRDPEATMNERGKHLIKLGLESIGKQAACIKEVHGIEPDSVAIFSQDVREVFSWNMDLLNEKAPTLSHYANVTPDQNNGGCLIATATYGSELAPQVQQLREIRDLKLLQTESGTSFMSTFNMFYYSFSPIIADYERENPVFREMVKVAITPMLTSLSLMEYAISENEVLGIGMSLIILNGLMYVGIPLIGIIIFKKKF